MRFVDTNVLLYAISGHPDEARKAARAAAVLNEPDLGLSVQVLQEFYVQATRPRSVSPLSHDAAIAFMETLLRFPVQPTSVTLLQAALEAKARWGLSLWDATIVEAARMLGCRELCTEDLQHGQDFDGVVVSNPFR